MNSPLRRVVMPLPSTSEKDYLTARAHPRPTMEQAMKALERSQETHRKSAQSMEKPQMSKAPLQVSSNA